MQRLRLGKSDVSVSRVILGCMGFAPTSPDDFIRTIHAAFDAGITSFDTAPLYGYGSSEELLGKAIADRRARVEILTKVGLRWDGHRGQVLFEGVDHAGVRRVVRKDGRRASVREEVERSLRRLGVEAIDLLQLHHPDPEIPIAESLEALAELKREGKARAVGVSNVALSELRAGAAVAPPPTLAAAQLEYNLLTRDVEASVLPWARAAEVAVLAYSPLAQGLLAGRQLGAGRQLPPDWRREAPYFAPATVAAVNRALEGVALPLARAQGASLSQLSLAWLLAQPGLTGVVVGVAGPERASESAAAADLKLSVDDERQLRAGFAGITPQAARQPPLAQRLLSRAGSLLRRKLLGG